MKHHKIRCLFGSMLVVLIAGVLYGQSGGTLPNFSIGVGARALGLGGACVALPLDATTIYWNPAALDHLDQKSITVFYTNLFGGAQYNYVGYVHPTIATGTFGVGILRIGAGNDIDYRLDSPLSLGKFGHEEYEFLFSYGKHLERFNLSVGGNVKVEYRSWPGLSDNNYSNTAVGADIAVFFRPQLSGALQGLSIGTLVQNIISPVLREDEGQDTFPINFKAGIAKPINLPEWGSQLILLCDFSKAQLNPAKFHVGTEYSYNSMAMLRMGLNDGEMVFGAGAAYSLFRFDYSFGSAVDSYFSASHRISLSVTFGKTKTELIETAERRRLEEIAEEVERARKLEIEQRIQEHMAEGKEYFQAGDYINAQIAFSSVLNDDEEHEEAKELLSQASQKYDAQEQKFWDERQEKLRLKQEAVEREKEIRKLWQRGRAYFENHQYRLAIRECEEVLNLDSTYALAKDLKQKALAEWKKEVEGLIAKADNLHADKRYHDAIRMLDEAKSLGFQDDDLQSEIDRKIHRYENTLDFEDLYSQALRYYNDKNYQMALEKFEKALALEPRNKTIQNFYNEAKARATATFMTMPPELQQKFVQGINLHNKGRYEDALTIFFEIREKQPNNKRILDAIDKAQEKLDRMKKQQR